MRIPLQLSLCLLLTSFSLQSLAGTFQGSGFGPIPDGPDGCGEIGEPLAITFEVHNMNPVVTVEVDMEISHDWMGDVIAVLVAPNDDSHLLFGVTGAAEGTCDVDDSNLNGLYKFTDDVNNGPDDLSWWQWADNLSGGGTMPSGSYQTTSMGGFVNAGNITLMNDAFSGVTDPNGTWTLLVYDHWVNVTGEVTDASLIINGAGGQISDGSAVYGVGTTGGGNILQSDIDYLFADRWFYRLDSDTKEYVFPVPNETSYSGDTATLSWDDVDGKGFSAELTHVIDQSGLPPEQATLTSTMTIVNLNQQGIELNLFHYTDFDMSIGDTGSLIEFPSHLEQVGGDYQAEFRAGGNVNYQIGNVETVAVPLTDENINDLTNAAAQFGPDDIRMAFQWQDVSVSPGIGYQVQTTRSIGGATAPVPADPVFSDLIFADDFE